MPSLWLLQLLAQNDLTVTQQHGILDLVKGSGLLVQGVLYLLILFSVLSWGIIFSKLNQMRRAKSESEKFIEIFWDSSGLRVAICKISARFFSPPEKPSLR